MDIWIISVVLAFVVTAVVGLFLSMILAKTKQINDGVSQIWDVGQMIAANTIHVPALIQTNSLVNSITEKVPGLLGELDRIESHAQSCENCPKCIDE